MAERSGAIPISRNTPLVAGCLGKPPGIAPHDAGIHAELGLRELGARGDLGRELVRLPSRGRIDRHIGGAEKELCRPANFAPGGKLILVAQVARHSGERGRVDVEHRFGFRLVAGLGVVAGQAEQVADVGGRRPHQLRLQRDAVAIAAGELEYRLDALADENGGGNRCREMRAGAGAVGDIDRIGQAAQWQRLVQQVACVA